MPIKLKETLLHSFLEKGFVEPKKLYIEFWGKEDGIYRCPISFTIHGSTNEEDIYAISDEIDFTPGPCNIYTIQLVDEVEGVLICGDASDYFQMTPPGFPFVVNDYTSSIRFQYKLSLGDLLPKPVEATFSIDGIDPDNLKLAMFGNTYEY